MDFLQPAVIIPILVAGLGWVCWKYRAKCLPKYFKKGNVVANKDGDEVEEGAPVYCRVADNNTGRIANILVPYKDIKKTLETYHTLGRQWKRDNKDVYALCKLKDGTYKPIIPPNKISHSPADLHGDLQFPEVAVLMDMREEKAFFAKYGQVLVWAGVMGFIIFMII